MSPPLNGIECQGLDLSSLPVDSLREAARIDLSYVINAYNNLPDSSLFFLENLFFDRLAGGPTLRQQILEGWPADSIRARSSGASPLLNLSTPPASCAGQINRSALTTRRPSVSRRGGWECATSMRAVPVSVTVTSAPRLRCCVIHSCRASSAAWSR